MRALKWTGIVLGALIALGIAALLIIPLFMDAETYTPQIEKMVAESTGCPFRMGGDLSLSLFPRTTIALSDLHLGSSPGFGGEDFVSVKSFELRAELLPLLSGEVVIKRVILDSPRMVVTRGKDGRWNWGCLDKGPERPEKEAEPPEETGPASLPIQSLAVDEFLIRDGVVLFMDKTTGMKKEIRDFRLTLEDVSLDKPIRVGLSALLDGQPVSVTGTVGPVGQEPGKGPMDIDLHVAALEEMDIKVKGSLRDAASHPFVDLDLGVSLFSPKKVMASLGQSFPLTPADPKALDSVALKLKIQGSPNALSISDGVMEMDDSKITFGLTAKEFKKPDLSFDLHVDTINLDRYLPPAREKKPESQKKGAGASKARKTDLKPLRRMVLDGQLFIDDLQIKRAKVRDLNLHITGRNGRFQLDPLAFHMYHGSVTGKASCDLGQDTPTHSVHLNAQGIQINPLLRDMFQEDFLEGYFLAELKLGLEGRDTPTLKRTLNGAGELVFTDGALKGINLTDMAQNVKSAFGAAEKGREAGRTDFSEVRIPFTAAEGVIHTSGATMLTPLMRLVARGKADLVQETLDFRVVPKGVATLKGKGDIQDRSGIMVPILVSGTFASPKFRPDLEGIARQQLKKRLKDVLKEKAGEDEASSEETVENLLKMLPLGE
ncbi:MAG: AsmA family protein [Thermodesulfobacteriota bacterium]